MHSVLIVSAPTQAGSGLHWELYSPPAARQPTICIGLAALLGMHGIVLDEHEPKQLVSRALAKVTIFTRGSVPSLRHAAVWGAWHRRAG